MGARDETYAMYEPFFEKLKGLGLKWELVNGGYVRAKFASRLDPRWTLQACPVSACADPPKSAIAWANGIEGSGLDNYKAQKIVNAADYARKHDRGLRKALLAALGLTEVVP